MSQTLSPEDHAALVAAVERLTAPTLTAKLSNFVGGGVEFLLDKLPGGSQKQIQDIVRAALEKAADGALWSLDHTPTQETSPRLHKLAAGTSGFIGGMFGFAALAIELPLSTTIMLRSVADIARSEGFDLGDDRTKQQCLSVLALGGNSADDDASDTGYYALRAFASEAAGVLAKELAQQSARSGFSATQGTAVKWLAELINKIASRFGTVVAQKVAAQAAPVVGGIAGATLNTMFTDYYQDVARGHFVVLRLEKAYGAEAVQRAFKAIEAASPRGAGRSPKVA